MALEMGVFEAKNKLSQLLDEAERGQRIYITRRGKRVAVLLGADAEDREGARKPAAVLTEIRTFRRNAKAGPESLKDLIDQGRR